MIASISFRNCRVVILTRDCLETVFSPTARAEALFTYDLDDRARAISLGYGADGVRQMHYERELLYTFLAEAEGKPYSNALADRAGFQFPPQSHWREGMMVMAFQRYLNLRTLDPAMDSLPNIQKLAAKFRSTHRLAYNRIYA